MGCFIKVANKKDLSAGRGMIVQADGKEIALFNVGGEFFATDNTCLHQGGPLGEGELEESVVTCPWHGWQFDVKTGQSTMSPDIKVPTFPTKVEGDDVFIEV